MFLKATSPPLVRGLCRLALLIPLALCTSGDTRFAPPPLASYEIAQRITLTPEHDGFDGELVLLQDSRTISEDSEAQWGTDEAMWCWETPDKLSDFCRSIRRTPLLHALVQLRDHEGRVWDSRVMERELARMASKKLYATPKHTHFITVDFSIGMGSYAGPITFLAEIERQGMKWLHFYDKSQGKNVELTLGQALKRNWALLPKKRGKGMDIYEQSCHPSYPAKSDDSHDFEITYQRYFFDGKKWQMLERRKLGFWENEYNDWKPHVADFL